MASMWKQHEAFDGTYDIHDLITINKLLDMQYENQRRAMRAAESKRASR
jgi:hypothetical protein